MEWEGVCFETARGILSVALALANSLPGFPRSWLSSRHKLALEPQAASPARRLYIVVAPGRSCSATCPVTPPPPGMPRDGEIGRRGLSCQPSASQSAAPCTQPAPVPTPGPGALAESPELCAAGASRSPPSRSSAPTRHPGSEMRTQEEDRESHARRSPEGSNGPVVTGPERDCRSPAGPPPPAAH